MGGTPKAGNLPRPVHGRASCVAASNSRVSVSGGGALFLLRDPLAPRAPGAPCSGRPPSSRPFLPVQALHFTLRATRPTFWSVTCRPNCLVPWHSFQLTLAVPGAPSDPTPPSPRPGPGLLRWWRPSNSRLPVPHPFLPTHLGRPGTPSRRMLAPEPPWPNHSLKQSAALVARWVGYRSEGRLPAAAAQTSLPFTPAACSRHSSPRPLLSSSSLGDTATERTNGCPSFNRTLGV